jgi:HD-GYP domain-containing protein (c-di-GMP phosphodiesterase class II)
VGGLEEVCLWASQHHEKPDGSGYPFGRRAEELDFSSRLLAVLDVYQGVCEDRPYHARRGHKETMKILGNMADKGLLDAEIVRETGRRMEDYADRPLPSPPQAAEAAGIVPGALPDSLSALSGSGSI